MPRTLISMPPAVARFHEGAPELPASFPYELRRSDVFCGADPETRRLGSGGGTVHLLHQAWMADRKPGQTLGEWLRAESRVMVHAGGESRRLPGYAAAGKAFLPLPLKEETPIARYQQTLVDLILPRYHEVLEEAGSEAALLLASGDVWLDFDTVEIPEMEGDLVGVGMRVSARKAREHGVFFVGKAGAPGQERRAREFYRFEQKPEVERIQELSGNWNFLVDTGIWLMSARAVEALFVLAGWDAERQEFATSDGLPGNLDFYGEVACALGQDPVAPLAGISGMEARVVGLSRAKFLHLGTSRQVFESLEQMQQTNWGTGKSIYRAFTPGKRREQPGRDMPVWLDGVLGALPDFGGNNFLTSVHETCRLERMGRGQCLALDPVSGSGGRYCFKAYDIDDLFRGDVAAKGSRICGISAPQWLEMRGIEIPAGTDVFDAAIFPLLRAEEIGQKWLDWFFATTAGGLDPEVTAQWREAEKASAREAAARFDVGEYFAIKRRGLKGCLEGLARRMRECFDPGIWLYDFAELARLLREEFPDLAEEIEAHAGEIRSRLGDSLEGARFEAFLAQLAGGSAVGEGSRRAFQVLARAVLDAQGAEPQLPVCALKSDQIVWARSPIRLDLAGGWTDAPPFCFEHGGAVLNIAVNLNGQPPIQVFVRPRSELTLKIHSIDLGISEEISSWEQLDTFRNPESGFSLPKCALALAGFLPEFCQSRHADLRGQLEAIGNGFEISLLAAVPKGSGLGTSSILAATLLAAIARACGLNWDRHDLFRRVLVMEQLLTTGGGWQDQAGALFAGLKLIRTEAGFSQIPQVRYLPDCLDTPDIANRQILLYYTGITRLAKNVLQQIVADMLLRKGETTAILQRIGRNADFLFDALQRQDRDALVSAIARSWTLNKRLDSGTCPPAVQDILDRCGPDLQAVKLLGAGGGGFLLILARSPEGGERIRQRLEANPPNDRARFIDASTSQEGLLVTVS